MSNTTVFLSSTCYDLSIIRSAIESFLKQYHIGVLNSENSNFPVTPGKHSHSVCLEQVKSADYLLLIIGNRRGGTYIGSERSITNEEYNEAVKCGIPRLIFIDEKVLDIIPIWKKNPKMDVSSIVDDVRIFDFIDYIRAESTDNWIFPFGDIDNIKETLLHQFAHYLQLFSKSLRKDLATQKVVVASKQTFVAYPSNTQLLPSDFGLEELTTLRNGLKAIYDIMTSIIKSQMKDEFKLESIKTLWLIGLYGELDDDKITIDNAVFSSMAWSTHRGDRIARQLKPFGIDIKYHYDEYDKTTTIYLSFNREDAETMASWALIFFIDELSKKHKEDAYNLFLKTDMRLFMS